MHSPLQAQILGLALPVLRLLKFLLLVVEEREVTMVAQVEVQAV
jgi:hypothetical protein